jgi:AraC-like DNA-binding protein
MPLRKSAAPRGLLQTPLPDGGRFEHARYHPSPDLAPFVEHFWAVRWNLTGLPSYRAETLPHPSVHLIFDQGAGARVAGVARGKFARTLDGRGGVWAAKFRPGGFAPFVAGSIDTFTDVVRPIAAVWGERGEDVARRVAAAADDDQRMEVVEEFLRGFRPDVTPDASLATTITEAIATDRTVLSVSVLTHRYGINLRRLQRLFARYVGVNPKWVIQRYRLHEAAERLVQGNASQAVLALELGYADQAHFVRDFKAAVGTSPAAYSRRAAARVSRGTHASPR